MDPGVPCVYWYFSGSMMAVYEHTQDGDHYFSLYGVAIPVANAQNVPIDPWPSFRIRFDQVVMLHRDPGHGPVSLRYIDAPLPDGHMHEIVLGTISDRAYCAFRDFLFP